MVLEQDSLGTAIEPGISGSAQLGGGSPQGSSSFQWGRWNKGRHPIPTGLLVWLVLFLLVIFPAGSFMTQSVSPRLFDQGHAWFTLSYLKQTLTGATLRSFVDSLAVASAASVLALVIALWLSWSLHRTDMFGRRVWSYAVWMLMLMPTYLTGYGWEYLLEPGGVLQRLGIAWQAPAHVIFGPVGVVTVLALSGLPFSYFVISSGLAGLGQEIEDAARIHGGSAWDAAVISLKVLAPAMLSAVAVVFAEAMSDFGVSSTLAYYSHFPMATFRLFSAINSNPANFGVAATLGVLLMASALLPIGIQARVMRKGSYRVLSARSRQPRRKNLGAFPRIFLGLLAAVVFMVALGVPIFGAVSASLMRGFGSGGSLSPHLSLGEYANVLRPAHLTPAALSTKLAVVSATVTVLVAVIMARLLSSRRSGRMANLVDLSLLGSMALPGIVLAAGYVFAFNAPALASVGINLYGTLPLLVMGYIATALPSQSRLLMGPMSQIRDSLMEASRIHGNGALVSWRSAVLPVFSRTLVWGWLLTFATTLMELPMSQMLYPPGQEPISVSISDLLSNYHYGQATAMTVVSVGEMFGVIAVVLAAFRIFAPRGWQRIGWPMGNQA